MSELQNLNGMNTNNKNISPVESQQRSPIRTEQLKEAVSIHSKKGNDAIAELSISILGLIETGVLTAFPINEGVELTQDITTIINEGLQDESPVTAQDRDTLDQLHGLIVALQKDEDEREAVEKSEQEKRAKNPPQMSKGLWWMK